MTEEEMANGDLIVHRMSDELEVIPYQQSAYDGGKIGLIHHHLTLPNDKARFAMALLERWGMVQGKDGGEDSAGRAKIDLMPVDEVVNRAIATATTAFDAFERLGWIDPIPSYNALKDDARKNSERN